MRKLPLVTLTSRPLLQNLVDLQRIMLAQHSFMFLSFFHISSMMMFPTLFFAPFSPTLYVRLLLFISIHVPLLFSLFACKSIQLCGCSYVTFALYCLIWRSIVLSLFFSNYVASSILTYCGCSLSSIHHESTLTSAPDSMGASIKKMKSEKLVQNMKFLQLVPIPILKKSKIGLISSKYLAPNWNRIWFWLWES